MDNQHNPSWFHIRPYFYCLSNLLAGVRSVDSNVRFVTMSLESTGPSMTNYRLATSYNHTNFFEKFGFFEVSVFMCRD